MSRSVWLAQTIRQPIYPSGARQKPTPGLCNKTRPLRT